MLILSQNQEWELVAYTYAPGVGAYSPLITTPPIDTSEANLFIAVLNTGTAVHLQTWEDSYNNSWPQFHTANALDVRRIVNPVVGPGHTFTTAAAYASFMLLAFKARILPIIERGASGIPNTNLTTSTTIPVNVVANSLLITAVTASSSPDGNTVIGLDDPEFDVVVRQTGMTGMSAGRNGGAIAWKFQRQPVNNFTVTWQGFPGNLGGSIVVMFGR